MRILFLTDSFNYCCGRSRHISILAKNLKAAGHEGFVIFGGGDAADLLQMNGISYLELPGVLHKNRSYINYLRAVLFIYKFQKKNRFDIFHTHHHYISSISRLTSYLTGTPQVMTIHGAAKKNGLLPFYTGDHLITVSNSTKEYLLSINHKWKDRADTIFNGIDITSNNYVDIRRFKNNINISSEDYVISVVGRVDKQKGHEILFDAINNLNDNKKITCLVIGEGDYLEELQKKYHSTTKNICFIGRVKVTDAYFQISDIIAIPSLNQEGLPITLLEAGKFRKPVIASNIGGIPEVITNGKNGLLFSPGNVVELSESIGILLNDENKRKELGEELGRTVSKNFSSSSMLLNTINIYKKLIHSKVS